jgi:predicted type IV restriction endonuclease
MGLDKATSAQLKRFAAAFKEARERGANESDTVMYLVKFFEEVLGYDSLKGEISKELTIKDRFCDIALKIEGEIGVLVEAKAAGVKALSDKSIEQAENYASRSGVQWVLLTNAIEWKLFHVTFAEGEGIAHDVAFSLNLLELIDKDPDLLWDRLSLLSKISMKKKELDDFWSRMKLLCPASVVRTLLAEPVLTVIRRELNREAPARLDVQDVFNAVRDTLSKEALAEAGDLGPRKKRRKRRKIQHKDPVTGEVTEREEEVDEDVGDTVGDNSSLPSSGARAPADGSPKK